jgi:hypothetical protein
MSDRFCSCLFAFPQGFELQSPKRCSYWDKEFAVAHRTVSTVAVCLILYYWSAWTQQDWHSVELSPLDEHVCPFIECLAQYTVYILDSHIHHGNELNLSVLKFKRSSFQLVSGLPPQVRSQASWCGRQSVAWTGFSLSSTVSPVSAPYWFVHLSPLLHDLSNWKHH